MARPEGGTRLGLELAAAPVAVMLVALVVFELGAFGLAELPAELAGALGGAAALRAGSETADALLALAELRARLSWLATVLVYFVAAGAAAAFAAVVLRCRPPRPLLAVGAALVAAEVAAALVCDDFAAVYAYPSTTLEASGALAGGDLAAVRGTVLLLNLVSAVVPVGVLLAGCCLAAPLAAGEGLAELEERLRGLRTVLHLGSALLVTGILHMLLWLRWPAALVPSDVGGPLEHVAAGVAVYWGAAYSLLIAVWYVPASRALTARARPLLHRHFPRDEDAAAWLRDRGHGGAPLARLPQAAAILAPLLAGPLGGALAGLEDVLG